MLERGLTCINFLFLTLILRGVVYSTLQRGGNSVYCSTSITASNQRSQLLLCSLFSVKINENILNNSVLKNKKDFMKHSIQSNGLCDLGQVSEPFCYSSNIYVKKLFQNNLPSKSFDPVSNHSCSQRGLPLAQPGPLSNLNCTDRNNRLVLIRSTSGIHIFELDSTGRAVL